MDEEDHRLTIIEEMNDNEEDNELVVDEPKTQMVNQQARGSVVEASPQLCALLSRSPIDVANLTTMSLKKPSQSNETLGTLGEDREDSSSTSTGAKEDDCDNEDDDDDHDHTKTSDSDQLKAFNMFVRLFVDENLDRQVPISRQPKEKISAIIASCGRQFPDMAEEARKRIRTYLKACRRNKRSREGNEANLSTRGGVAHLSSPAAEHLLARACENEAENAKRMRMGLEPIAQTLTPTTTMMTTTMTTTTTTSPMDYQPNLMGLLSAVNTRPGSKNNSGNRANGVANGLMGGNSSGNTNYVSNTNNGSVVSSSGMVSNGLNESLRSSGSTRLPLLTHKLSQAEMGAVRQLITGYRESAAFLLRSADELEHLLLVQPKV